MAFDSTVRECSIEGEWIEYRVCSEDFHAYDDMKNKTYIGFTDMYRINGTVNRHERKHHHWQWKQ